jgi:hypothetical protein
LSQCTQNPDGFTQKLASHTSSRTVSAFIDAVMLPYNCAILRRAILDPTS